MIVVLSSIELRELAVDNVVGRLLVAAVRV
jgi:hypothetical protein